MTKQFTINHFYWSFNQLDCFNSNLATKVSVVAKTFVMQTRNRHETLWQT